ncbi:hypothetical protein SNE40_020660 [Patella caerulea]|uniref:Uncharacterized protein n=1 Tax=Patella caerulea TaxID=87958 RepID=A0AAN8J5G2_PATCE
MTKPGIHHNFNSFSLFYESYLEMEKHFYCSCEITADDDVYIYTRVDSILLIGIHNTSVKIYSQDHTVRYDVDNTDHNGYKYLIYKQLKQTKGPIYLVYEGDELIPYDDKISINFKGNE